MSEQSRLEGRQTSRASLLQLLYRQERMADAWTRTVLKNMAWVTLAEFVVRGLKFALLPLVARFFGPTEYGKFTYAFSFVSLFAVIYDAGLSITATREFSKARENERLLPDIILVKLLLGAVGLAAIAFTLLWVPVAPDVRAMIAALAAAFYVLEWVSLGLAIVRARQKMEYEFLLRVIQAVALLGGCVLVIWKFPSVINVSYAYLGSGLLSLVLVVAALRRRRWPLGLAYHPDVWRGLFRVALPLAMAGGATTLYMNLDTVLLGSLGSITATGWYNLAAKLTGILLVPTSLLSLAIFPAFASTAANVDRVFRRRWEEWSVHLAAIGVFGAAVVFAGADRIIDILVGPAFHPAALALRILTVTVVLIYLYTPLYQAMIVFNEQGRLFWLLAAGTLLNLGLNVLLIPRYSLYGAAWATVLTHLGLLGGLYVFVGRFTPLAPVSTGLLTGFLAVMVSGVPAYLIVQVTTVSLWLTIPPAGLAFLCCFLGLRRIAVAPQTSA